MSTKDDLQQTTPGQLGQTSKDELANIGTGSGVVDSRGGVQTQAYVEQETFTAATYSEQ